MHLYQKIKKWCSYCHTPGMINNNSDCWLKYYCTSCTRCQVCSCLSYFVLGLLQILLRSTLIWRSCFSHCNHSIVFSVLSDNMLEVFLRIVRWFVHHICCERNETSYMYYQNYQNNWWQESFCESAKQLTHIRLLVTVKEDFKWRRRWHASFSQHWLSWCCFQLQ